MSAIVAVANSRDVVDEREGARRLAALEECMQSWFRAKGWSPPPPPRGAG